MTELATAPRPQAVVDDTNHDLVHALSVRLDARWQEGSYGLETHCAGCRQVFDRLREIDREAAQLLSVELAAHVRSNRFPLDISD